MTFPSSLFKTIPTGKPSLVQPTLNKIDVEALKRDLKKFEENYPVRVSRAWAQWLQDIDKLLELPIYIIYNAVLGHYTMSQCPYKFTNIEK